MYEKAPDLTKKHLNPTKHMHWETCARSAWSLSLTYRATLSCLAFVATAF